MKIQLSGSEMKACDSVHNWASSIMTCFRTTATKVVDFPHTVEISASASLGFPFCPYVQWRLPHPLNLHFFIIKVCIFIGETLLFLNWAITADILMVSTEDLFLRRTWLEILPKCTEITVVYFSCEVSK